jgi:sulfatase modifying factor 1
MLDVTYRLAISFVVLPIAACDGSNVSTSADAGAGASDASDEAATGGSGGSGDAALDATRCSASDEASGSGGATEDSGTPGPSCSGLARTCGPHGDDDCCASSIVPGGTFYRSYDGVTYTDNSNPATVSDFRLDRYEITVGRFRKFAAVFSQDMIPEGAGKNPNDPNDPGWSTEWNAKLPKWDIIPSTGAQALASALKCAVDTPYDVYQTWTDTPGANENLPINCLTWYEAYAFCIWDGGRLPTEAEWNYAAAGGCEQRPYPWSSPPDSTSIDNTYAIYCSDSCSGPQTVGAKSPKGDSKWGHADMLGNIEEWILDWYASSYPNPCVNCTNFRPDLVVADPRFGTTITRRVDRGGAFLAAELGFVPARGGTEPEGEGAMGYRVQFGARCARTP